MIINNAFKKQEFQVYNLIYFRLFKESNFIN